MNTDRPEIVRELDRRLALVGQEWEDRPVPALQRADLVALAAIVVLAGLLGLVAGVAR